MSIAKDHANTLDAFARAHSYKPPRAVFIYGEFNLTTPNGARLYTDEGLNWCRSCAEKLVTVAKPLLPAAQRDTHILCEATTDAEDSSCICYGCAVVLDHGLSDHGVNAELDHYQNFAPLSRLLPGDAWQIARLLEAAPHNADVLTIGAAAAALAGRPKAAI